MKRLVMATSLIMAPLGIAQENVLPRAMPEEVRSEIEYARDSNVANQIPYFDNRFKIDANIDEITLLFYRKLGTPPIILVRPDGSKLKIGSLPKDKVSWYDDRTFDMVKIKKPMPGPWQAIGAIEPNSRIMVISEVRIEVEPLPEVLLAGETLKVTGQLFNGEDAIDAPAFRGVVNLDVDFFSTNNTAFDNFGAKPIKLTTFRDDGYDLDEYRGDSIFTGEFTLDFAPGEWIPTYYVKLPMAKRELKQKPVIIRHNPITIEANISENPKKNHHAVFNIANEFVDPDSVIFQGKVTYPDKQEIPFSIMEGSGLTREHEIENTEGGIFRVRVGAYGKTVNGREFRLVVPEFTFNVEDRFTPLYIESAIDGSESMLSTEEGNQPLLPKLSKEEELEILLEQQAIEQAEEDKQTYIAIGIANGVIIFVFIIGFGFYRWRIKKKS